MLVRKHFCGLVSDSKKHISNLSYYSLSETETFLLGNGLEFCIPPQRINREELFAEFEILHAQLARRDISEDLEFNKLRARLSVLTNEVYDRIRPTGSHRPQMYGLPKIHKPN